MRKRVRKKRRLGEFLEFGFRVRMVTATGLTDAERDRLLRRGMFMQHHSIGMFPPRDFGPASPPCCSLR